MNESILQIGDASLARVEEMIDATFTARSFFPLYDAEVLRAHRHWLSPKYYVEESDALILSMHSWIVKTGRHTVLIDTCVGNDKDRLPRAHWHEMKTPYLDRLRAAGTSPEEVDFVLCTHLHPDHVGWNTMLKDGRWVPTFPNARYLFSRVEYTHWTENPDPSRIRHNSFLDSVLPVVQAGNAEMIEDGHQLDDALTIELSPGHTPGNAHIRLASRGMEAIFSGDVIHHPIQVCRPDWYTMACYDPTGSVASRRKLLERACESDALVLPAHFPAPYGGRIRARGTEFQIQWLA